MKEDGLDRLFLEVGRVAVFVEYAFDDYSNFGAGAFAVLPVDHDAFGLLAVWCG